LKDDLKYDHPNNSWHTTQKNKKQGRVTIVFFVVTVKL